VEESGDATVPEQSAIVEGSEIHPVQQAHGTLYVDRDVKKRLKTERATFRSPYIFLISGLKTHVRSRRQSSQPNAGCPQTNTEKRSVMLFIRTFLKRISLISFLSFYLLTASRILPRYEGDGFVKLVDFNFYFHLIVIPAPYQARDKLQQESRTKSSEDQPGYPLSRI
jgi:hypothetical protein